MSGNDWLMRLMGLPLLILSLSVHEWAHAWSAYKLGDDTASKQGRLTLNPLAHIDFFGTIVLPLLGVPFGWAKPVPVNPLRFRREVTMKAGMMVTAAAGPLSNLFIALVCAVGMGLMIRFGVIVLDGTASGVHEMMLKLIVMNLGLFVFNFLPVPPLDGSRIADGLMPYRLRPMWEQVVRYSGFVLIALVIFGGSVISGPIKALFGHLRDLILFIGGH